MQKTIIILSIFIPVCIAIGFLAAGYIKNHHMKHSYNPEEFRKERMIWGWLAFMFFIGLVLLIISSNMEPNFPFKEIKMPTPSFLETH